VPDKADDKEQSARFIDVVREREADKAGTVLEKVLKTW
jgi:hypothetical protein